MKSPTATAIRKLRESAGLSQTEAAASVFVSLRTWQNWEDGTHPMRPAFWSQFQQVVKDRGSR